MTKETLMSEFANHFGLNKDSNCHFSGKDNSEKNISVHMIKEGVIIECFSGTYEARGKLLTKYGAPFFGITNHLKFNSFEELLKIIKFN